MTRPALRAGEVQPLVRTLDRCPDPVALFARLCGTRPDTALLESGDRTTPDGEKSVLAVRAALRLTCRGRTVEVRALGTNGASVLPWLAEALGAGGAEVTAEERVLVARYPEPPKGNEDERLKAPSPVDAIRLAVKGPRGPAGERVAVPLAIGVFAYDLLGSYETLPPPHADPLGWPDFELWVPDRLVWVNHRQRRTTVVAEVYGGEHADAAYNDAAADIATLAAACEEVDLAGPPERPARAARTDEATVDVSDAEYAALVATLKGHIVAGDVFQIVPSRTFSLPCPAPLAAYAELRALNPSPYMFYVNGTAGTLFGASPETAVRVSGAPPIVEIRPIAGTRRRARRADGSYDHDLDSRLEAELRLDAKELAEHMMLVDLARNDVARVSVPGTRWVDRLLMVERFSHVMHLVSNVRGQLRADLDPLHAYVATMNMGTLVGAPKLEAAALLRRYERTRRGPYGGAIGYVTADGRLETSIVIRSAVVRDGVAHVRAGAGIVYDSDPMAEADETRRKAEAVLAAVRRAGEGAP